MQRLLIRDFQLHAAVNDIAFQPVQADDFLVVATVAEVLLGDSPEGIPMHHGMNAVGFGRLCADYGECGNLDGRHDGVSATFVPVDNGEVTHTSIHPVAGAAFVRKPPVHGQYHLIRLWIVVQRFRLVPKPEQLGFAVAFADVHTELDERPVDDVLERIRFGGIGSALDGDGSLVVGIGRRTPGAVSFLNIHTDPSVCADAVVAAGLLRSGQKDVAQRFHAALTHHAVRRDAVNAVGALSGMVVRKFGVGHHGTVRISHIIRPPFPHGHEAAPARISVFREWAVPDAPHFQLARRPHWRCRRKLPPCAERCRCQ